jgi:hypothetical protein
VLAAQRDAQREFRLLSAQEIRDVADSVLNPPAAAASENGAAATAPKAKGGLFGGFSLFGAPAESVSH